jgi:hypothetical protein
MIATSAASGARRSGLRRNRARAVAAVAGLLLVCITIAGCNQHAATSQQSAAAAVPSPTATDAGASASATDVPSVAPTDSIASIPAGPPTPDAVASELDQINQLINDINNSVQTSDSSTQGGE